MMNEIPREIKTMLFQAIESGVIAVYHVYELALEYGRDYSSLAADIQDQSNAIRHGRIDDKLQPTIDAVYAAFDVEEETPADDYDWQDDNDDRGWLTYSERMAAQSRAEM